MKILRYIQLLGCLLSSAFLWSCDVHQFPYPVEREVPFVLHLTYDTELPLYKTLIYDNESRTGDGEDIDVRYTINVYPVGADMENSREVLYNFVFTKDDISEFDHSVELKVEPGLYKFMVWSDYVKTDGGDLYYTTSDFSGLRLIGDSHPGSNDLRDAFRGVVESEVSSSVTEARVTMQRPMAKFNFITDDMDEFIANVQRSRATRAEKDCPVKTTEAITKAVDIADFDIVFRYTGFMPTEFNMFTDKPSDSETGVVFKSKMSELTSGEVELGFDYVFTNGTESAVNLSIEVYDYDGTLLSTFRSVNVPLLRSHLTTIKAKFLTSGTGGVTVVPEFDGEYNYVVD